MTSAEIFIPIKFPTLNDYTAAQRTNVYVGSAMKKKYTGQVRDLSLTLKHFNNPVHIKFKWQEENKRRDPDNIIFAKKFILDGLVEAGVLRNDTQEWILSFKETWVVNKANIGVWVTIMEE